MRNLGPRRDSTCPRSHSKSGLEERLAGNLFLSRATLGIAGRWGQRNMLLNQRTQVGRYARTNEFSSSYLCGLDRIPGALLGWDGAAKLPEQEYLRFPFHTEDVLGLRTALGCPTCAARAAPFPHRALRRAEGASLWVEGKSPFLERAGLRELLMPRGATRFAILASLTVHQTAAQRSYATSLRLHSDSMTKPGYCASVLPTEAN